MPDSNTLTKTVLQLMQRLQNSDAAACAELMAVKIPVVGELGDDFICQTARGGKLNLTVLGLLNSVLLKAGQDRVAAVIDDDNQVIGFTERFTPTKPVAAPIPPKA